MKAAPLSTTALIRIPVGVVVERRKAHSLWAEFLWRPVCVLVGKASAAPWTPIAADGEAATFYAGEAVIELYRSETANYRDNLASGSPSVWVVLRPVASEPAFEIVTVTADPSEGEAMTDAGSDLVEIVTMPAAIIEQIGSFIAEHHVERPFAKREREKTASKEIAK